MVNIKISDEILTDRFDDIHRFFTYHPPTKDDLPKYESIRSLAKQFAELLAFNVPFGSEYFIAIEKLREAVMWANAGIACAKKD